MEPADTDGTPADAEGLHDSEIYDVLLEHVLSTDGRESPLAGVAHLLADLRFPVATS